MIDIVTFPAQYFLSMGVNSMITFVIYLAVAVHATIGFFGATIWNVIRVVIALIVSLIVVQLGLFVVQLMIVLRS